MESYSENNNHVYLSDTCQHCGSNTPSTRSQFSSQSSGYSNARSRPSTSLRQVAILYRGKIAKLTVLVFFSLVFMGVYVNFFKHPPPDILLQMNQRGSGDYSQDFGASSFQKHDSTKSKRRNDDTDEELVFAMEDNDEKGGDEEEQGEEDGGKGEQQEKTNSKREISDSSDGEAYWSKFLKTNNFVPIGAVYTKCDGDKVQLGTVILEEDKELGGIRSRTFINMTIGEEITGGQFHIEVKYNGQDLYDNYWEICELEADLAPQNKTFTCPIQPGRWSKVKAKHIPGYLPTGRYQTKAWAVDEAENVIACGFSDFKI